MPKVDSEKTDIIDAALLEVQRALKLLGKDGSAKTDRGGSELKLKFATLELVYEACHDLLVTNGIMLWQGGERDGNTERLITVLAKGGQQRVSSFPIIAREGAQNFGGGLGFAKRWGLQAAVGIFTTDKLEQNKDAGYDTKPARRAPAPAGLPATLAALRDATTTGQLAELAALARGQYPKGEEARAVEEAITASFVAALDTAPDAAAITAIRVDLNRVKPRGNVVRDTLIAAEARTRGQGS